MNKTKVSIFTDGACAGNPGPGGWGALLICGQKQQEIYGGKIETTNNQMELQAAIEALRYLNKSCIIDLYTDSRYVQLGVTEWMDGWKRKNWRKSDNKPIKNLDLWQDLDQEVKRHEINWHWVKGHADNQGNIIADQLAVKGKNEIMNNK